MGCTGMVLRELAYSMRQSMELPDAEHLGHDMAEQYQPSASLQPFTKPLTSMRKD